MTTFAKTALIGLSGTNGGGKDTVGELLSEYHNYLFISLTDIMRDYLRSRGLAPSRENMRNLSEQWRKQSGKLGVLVDKALEQFELVKDDYAGLVVASLRNPGEADRVHELGGLVIWVDASPRHRYDRIQANLEARGRHDDHISFEQFVEEENIEMHREENASEESLHIHGVKLKSDYQITNDTEKETLLRKVEETLSLRQSQDEVS